MNLEGCKRGSELYSELEKTRAQIKSVDATKKFKATAEFEGGTSLSISSEVVDGAGVIANALKKVILDSLRRREASVIEDMLALKLEIP